MQMTSEAMLAWCKHVLGISLNGRRMSLADYLAGIPRLESFSDLQSGTPVLVRGDLDAKPGDQIGEGDVRLRSMVETLKFGRRQGWKQIIFGHIGRKPEGSLAKVAKRLGQLMNCEVPLVADWLDPGTLTIHDSLTQQIAAAPAGSLIMLENTRKYDIERVLWEAGEADLPQLSGSLAKIANQFYDKVAKAYINEALSAGSLDTSTTVVPAAMDRVCLGAYVAGEFTGPMMRCMETQFVIFSGLKIDKLDDLEAMIGRGTIRYVVAAGSLAMALKKAAAQLDGGDFHLGLAEDPAHSEKPYYIPPERVDQAKAMLVDGRAKGIEFVLPVDFVLGDGRVSREIGPGNQQFDIGPASSELFEQAVGRFLAQSGPGAVAFHNGVFGMFEDPRFEEGTRRFIPQLKRMKDAGVEVYVGGGEGGTALERYGKPDWVTHTFTAGGTVLNALGSQPVPYLVALQRAACAK